MTRAQNRRQRGTIDQLPSGTFRVRVYAGVDPLTHRRHTLQETAEPRAEAERARVKLLSQVDERRQPRSKATLGMLIDRSLEVADVEESTLHGYRSKIETHIRPTLGDIRLSKVDAELLETFYARLRRCREQCGGRPRVGHECKPLSASSVRQMHFILRRALGLGVRWRWVSVNAAADARPPSPDTAGSHASESEAGGGAPDPSLGEGPGLGLPAVGGDDDRPAPGGAVRAAVVRRRRRAALLTIARAYVPVGRRLIHKDTKTHQRRRIALSPESIAVLAAHRDRATARAALVGAELKPDAFLFSAAPDSSVPLLPGSVSQKYSRQARAIGVDSQLHELRHYSATELLAAGVDLRTVAGRLGHDGGGATTLRVYAAWVPESDRRAAAALARCLPASASQADRDPSGATQE
jgi:integrase